MGNKNLGIVSWFDDKRGYGFIKMVDDPDNTEYFVHFSSILSKGFKTLKQDQEVLFNFNKTDKGIQAVDVEPIG